MRYTLPGVLVLIYFIPLRCLSQDQPGLTDRIVNFPSKFFSRINSLTAILDKNLTSQTEKYLDKLAKKEAKLRKKIYRQDSTSATRLFANNPVDYVVLKQKLESQTGAATKFTGSSYLGLDSHRK